nr:hypothetical protein CFP56_31470 [Quercus suber]
MIVGVQEIEIRLAEELAKVCRDYCKQEVEVAKGKEAIQDGHRPEDKGKGKEIKPLPEAKGIEATLTNKDAVSKTKDAEPKSKTADPKSKVADPKDDPS